MTPEELSIRHPKLYHIIHKGALPSMRKHGLLSTTRLLTLFEVPSIQFKEIGETVRPTSMVLTHDTLGTVKISDNAPIDEGKLSRCLDDELQVSDWMRILNRRVFFWVDTVNLDNHLRACIRRGEDREVLVFDTLKIARRYLAKMEVSAINTGSTLRRPVRRGIRTFAAAEKYSYSKWQKLRGGRDKIKELTILDGLTDLDAYLVGFYDFSHLK